MYKRPSTVTVQNTEYWHKPLLVQSLKKMGYSVLQKETYLKDSSYLSLPLSLDMAVDLSPFYRVGFKRGHKGYFKIFAEWDSIYRSLGISFHSFQKDLDLVYDSILKKSYMKQFFFSFQRMGFIFFERVWTRLQLKLIKSFFYYSSYLFKKRKSSENISLLF